MKRKIFFPAVCFCLWANFAEAQWTLGESVGINEATQKHRFLEIPAQLDFGYGTFFKASIFAERNFGKHFSAGLELGYAPKGNSLDVVFAFPDQTETTGFRQDKMTYWEASLDLKYRVLTGKFRPYPLAGASVGYLSNWVLLIEHGALASFPAGSSRHEEDLTMIERQEFTLFGGLGLEMQLGGQGHLFAEARYQHGLVDFAKTDKVDWRNRSYSFSVGYAFQMAGKSPTIEPAKK